MDPVLRSTLTSLFVAVCGGGLTAIGVHAGADQMTVANAVIGALILGAGALTTWWKATQHTAQAQIDVINKTPNGLKVVRADVDAEAVTAPLPVNPASAVPIKPVPEYREK